MHFLSFPSPLLGRSFCYSLPQLLHKKPLLPTCSLYPITTHQANKPPYPLNTMKGMDLFCSSPASTAVTSSMDHRSLVRRITKSYDHERRKSQLHVPCSSQLPINPKHYYEKRRKSSADKQDSDINTRRQNSVQVNDLYSHPTGSSRRYLLGDTPIIDWVSESDKIPAMAPAQPAAKSKVMNRDESPAHRSSSSVRSRDQVVVLRVSLHCRACEGKVRKHISKMEGVTSFSIDMETKKVTIIGDVTPLGVLASVSKVKNAQLWPSPTSSSSSLSSSSSMPTSPWST